MPEKNKLSLSVQYPDPRLKDILARPLLRRWVASALQGPAELTLRFVDQVEAQSLNRDYRGKDYATNVLTFCYNDEFEDEDGDDEDGDEGEPDPAARADIILCTDVLQSEAQAQNKTLLAHSAHLIVHGVLHAQGYDHEDEIEAEAMEQLETAILARLGFANPYAERD
jgi:probable rRNA maturation factor